MPTQILFVQGAGERVHDEWDAKLVESLERALGDDSRIAYPRMPNEADPQYSAWKSALIDELGRLDDGAVLIGHSIGGAFLVHVLAEASIEFKPSALVLIAAPFIGDGGWPVDEIRPKTDLAARLPETMRVFVFHGTDDAIVPLAHAKLYADAIPRAAVRVLPQRDHQLDDGLADVANDIRRLLSERNGARDADD